VTRSGFATLCLTVGGGLLIPGSLPTPATAQERQSFRHVSVEQGLSHGSVRDIMQDRQGFIWIATEDGLNRYDGVNLKVFRHEHGSANSLSSSNFGKLIQDRSGMIWYGTWGGGLNRYNPLTDTFTHFRYDPDDSTSISQDRTEALYEDRFGDIWVGTPDRGLNRFHRETEQFTRYRFDPEDPGSLASDAVKAIFESDDGRLWIGTDAGLDVLDRSTETFDHNRHDPDDPTTLGSNMIRSLARDTSGALWVGTRGGGLNLLDPATGRVRRFIHDPDDSTTVADDEIARVFVDSRGTLWIGTYDEGVDRFDAATGSFVHFRHDLNDPRSLSNDRVEVIFEDRTGVLWFGTVGDGVDRIDLKPRKFVNYWHDPLDPSTLPHPTVRSIANGKADSLWVGTDGGGLALLDEDARVVSTFSPEFGPNSRLGDRVWAILPAGPDSVWIGTYGAGLVLMLRLEGRTEFRHFAAQPGVDGALQDPDVKALARDRMGTLWVGTTNGLYRLDNEGAEVTFERFGHDDADPNSLAGDYINALTASGGFLWVGTLHGLDRFDPGTGDIRHFPADPSQDQGLSAPIITTLLESLGFPGTLWIGTEDGGLNRLDPDSGVVAHYLVGDDRSSSAISAMVEDRHGALWLGTSQGISRFDAVTELFTNYSVADGLVSHSFMLNAGAHRPDGRIFFGGIKGLASFLPDSVLANPYIPSVVLTSFRVFTEEIKLEGPLQTAARVDLPHDRNFVAIDFAALDYSTPEKNQYIYRLFGVDPEWIDAGNRTFASYPALPPGRYTFWVRGSNNDGVWNHSGATIQIVVHPAWWVTWWFRTIALLVFSVTVVRVIQYRTRRIHERTLELEAINRSLSDQMFKRRQAEDHRERLIPELEARNTELERFTYTVSHDLKSPLVTITGFLGILERDLVADNQDGVARDVDQIRTAARRMQQLLDELLDLSRAGRFVNPPTVVDLGEVAEEAVALLEGQAADRGVTITIERDMPIVYGDRVRLLQVFQNLIQNGIKFTGDQDDPRVEIGARQQDREWVISVRDNGAGIKPAYHKKIFGLFDQLAPGQEGTGIGLALVHRIVEVHGGRVWVESEGEGNGSLFSFTLPLGRPTSPEWDLPSHDSGSPSDTTSARSG